MKPENAIEVKNLEKSFKVYLDEGSSLKEKILFSKRNRYDVRQVLKGISFEVKKGEAIGLIGHNGCGKSTTLKLLTRIIYPNSGTIEMKGRIASLIELGAGFHPDMSGRENIYTNASIFGLTKSEIDARVDDIIEFSELEEFIDNPVRTYSSGMYMRLAFSVAINVDADILLVDEILAVGDAAFQAKCFNKMREIKSHGTTIVIVSHSLGQIEQICDRSIWIHEGRIREEGLPRDVDPLYMEYMSQQAQEREKEASKTRKSEESEDSAKEIEQERTTEEDTESKKEDKKNRWGSGEAVMTAVTLFNMKKEQETVFKANEGCIIEIGYEAEKELNDVVVGVAIYREDQTYIYGTNTLIDTSEPVHLKGKGKISLKIEKLPLNQGTYALDFALHRTDGFSYDFWRDVVRFSVKNSHQEAGIVSLLHEWSCEQKA